MKAKIYILPKDGILDPQGNVVDKTLKNLGFKDVLNVRVGKFIELHLNVSNKEKSNEEIKSMCDQLLVNSVIEEYNFEILEY